MEILWGKMEQVKFIGIHEIINLLYLVFTTMVLLTLAPRRIHTFERNEYFPTNF